MISAISDMDLKLDFNCVTFDCRNYGEGRVFSDFGQYPQFIRVIFSLAPKPAEQQINASVMVGFKGFKTILCGGYFFKKAVLRHCVSTFGFSKGRC